MKTTILKYPGTHTKASFILLLISHNKPYIAQKWFKTDLVQLPYFCSVIK